MNFTCTECNDTGSRDKLGTYLDCNACGTAATRRDLNDFVKSLGPTHPEDVALAIHQRALAMAQKQEAPEPAPEIRTVLRDALASGLTMAYGCSRVWSAWGVGTMSQDDFYPASECEDLLDELCDLAIAALRPDLTAPAAANGALTDERAAFEADTLDLYPSAKFNRFPSGTYTDSSIETQWGAWQRRSKFAAAGPDAALIDALEKAEKKFLELEHMLGGGDDEVSVEVEILTIRAALSGAKGN